MKRRHAIVLAMALGTVGSIGCDKAAPTEPARSLADMRIAKVVAQPTDLSGSWSGTITFHAFESDTEVLPCDGTASMRVNLRQDGESLSGRFETACAGEVAIRGVVNSIRILGLLDGSNGHNYGSIDGTASSSGIRFQTHKRIDKNRGAITAEVDLHRSQLAERTSPIVVDSGRSPRALAARQP
jgi:hypothetical protein